MVAVARVALLPILGDVARLLPFLLAVVLAARFGGLLPGLFATGLSGLVAVYLFIQPRFTFAMDRSGAVGLTLYLITGAAISWVCESL